MTLCFSSYSQRITNLPFGNETLWLPVTTISPSHSRIINLHPVGFNVPSPCFISARFCTVKLWVQPHKICYKVSPFSCFSFNYSLMPVALLSMPSIFCRDMKGCFPFFSPMWVEQRFSHFFWLFERRDFPRHFRFGY